LSFPQVRRSRRYLAQDDGKLKGAKAKAIGPHSRLATPIATILQHFHSARRLGKVFVSECGDPPNESRLPRVVGFLRLLG
jgi:hypothetical protein